jgi:hypothetical protein
MSGQTLTDMLDEIRNQPSHWCPYCRHPYTEDQINEAFCSADYSTSFEFLCWNTACRMDIEVNVDVIPQFSLRGPL